VLDLDILVDFDSVLLPAQQHLQRFPMFLDFYLSAHG
jgi:hypothetical protein